MRLEKVTVISLFSVAGWEPASLALDMTGLGKSGGSRIAAGQAIFNSTFPEARAGCYYCPARPWLADQRLATKVKYAPGAPLFAHGPPTTHGRYLLEKITCKFGDVWRLFCEG